MNKYSTIMSTGSKHSVISVFVFIENYHLIFRDSIKCLENFDRLRRRHCYKFGFEVVRKQFGQVLAVIVTKLVNVNEEVAKRTQHYMYSKTLICESRA